jgi:hypothetical protein
MAYDRVNKGYTFKATAAGFLFGCLWGVISFGTWFELRKLLVMLWSLISPNGWAYPWRSNVVLVVLGLLWLIGFFVVWNRSEHNLVQKRFILHTLKYTFWSLGIWGGAWAVNMFLL